MLKSGELLLTHYIDLITNYEETRKELSEEININVFSLPKDEGIELFSNLWFSTVNFSNDELILMTP